MPKFLSNVIDNYILFLIMKGMYRFALLKLHSGGNFVICEEKAENLAQAVAYFKKHVTINFNQDVIVLDDEGYAKYGDMSFCVAQFLY